MGIDRVVMAMRKCGNRLADARAIGPVTRAAGEPRQIGALDLLLQVEHGDIVFASQRAAEPSRLAPGFGIERAVPPAAERNRNHPADATVERDKRHERVFGDPVDRELRAMLADVGDERERMDDVAQRRRPHDQYRIHRSSNTTAESAWSARPTETP